MTSDILHAKGCIAVAVCYHKHKLKYPTNLFVITENSLNYRIVYKQVSI